MRRSFALAPVLIALTACGGGEKAPPPAAPAPPPVVKFEAKDYAFAGPDTIKAGMTTLQLTNNGPGFHHMQLVRLDSGKTVADLKKALAKPGMPPMWAVFVPGPNAPDPGGQSNATLDVAAGNYAVICLIDFPDAMPHFARGMIKGLTVTPASGAGATAPLGDVSITLSDYSFVVSKPFVAGKQVITVSNKGPQPHEIEVIRFDAGKTIDDLGKWMAKPVGPPPGHGMGGVSATLPGTAVSFSVDLAPGDYAIVCFIPDAKDGKPHLAHGMIQTFKI